jgi:prevent-host-death family protein
VKKIEIADASAPLGTYAKHVKKEPVIITEKGKPIAALVAIDAGDEESLSLSANPRFLDLIGRSRRRLKREGGIPAEEMCARVRRPK